MTKRTQRTRIAIAALALWALALNGASSVARAQIGCGIEPIALKPIPPIGCRDMVHQCACTAGGACYWVWVCVQ